MSKERLPYSRKSVVINRAKQSGASVKAAVQKRHIKIDHSSIIPGVDVNDLKRSLDILKYALDYSEAIVDTVRLPLVVLNKKLQVLTANKSFYDTFKLTPKKTENKLIYMLNSRAWNIPKLRHLLEKILVKNTHFENFELDINFPHIGRRIMLLNARKTYRQVNNTEAILLALDDVTVERQLEKQKDHFIGMVSHELITPLTVIKLFSQQFEKYLVDKKDKEGFFYISKIAGQIERLEQLMASFTKVYSIQTGNLKLQRKIFNLNELIKLVISDFRFTAKSHTIFYKGQSGVFVYADKERISQTLINLISNAIKYSPDAKKINILMKSNPKEVTVSVRDFGFGINKEEQEKVFERFFRVEDKNNISGLGLGLYISSEIIKRHMGKIWVKSVKDKGSTFTFTLPRYVNQ